MYLVYKAGAFETGENNEFSRLWHSPQKLGISACRPNSGDSRHHRFVLAVDGASARRQSQAFIIRRDPDRFHRSYGLVCLVSGPLVQMPSGFSTSARDNPQQKNSRVSHRIRGSAFRLNGIVLNYDDYDYRISIHWRISRDFDGRRHP